MIVEIEYGILTIIHWKVSDKNNNANCLQLKTFIEYLLITKNIDNNENKDNRKMEYF